MDKVIYLISGSIAAGKSTITYNFINRFQLADLPYVSTDTYYRVFFEQIEGCDFDDKYNMTRKFTDYKLDGYFNEGKSFVWETVLSKKKKQDFLQKCKDAGYKIICIFVGAPLEDTLSRSVKRTNEGDHSVEESFLQDRYQKSLKALIWLKDLVDILAIIDNSTRPELIYYQDSTNIYKMKNLPAWVNGAL